MSNRARKITLEFTDPTYQWIARDRDLSLHMFINPPIKEDSRWVDPHNPAIGINDCHQFEMVQWEDTHPKTREELE